MRHGPLLEIDWTEIVLDLRRAGMRQHEIAREMGKAATEGLVRQYLSGATPLHWRGEMLLELWERKTGKSRDRAPMRPADIPRPGPRRRRQQRVFLPQEHVQALAAACGISVSRLMAMLMGKRAARKRARAVNLVLPGFEE